MVRREVMFMDVKKFICKFPGAATTLFGCKLKMFIEYMQRRTNFWRNKIRVVLSVLCAALSRSK